MADQSVAMPPMLRCERLAFGGGGLRVAVCWHCGYVAAQVRAGAPTCAWCAICGEVIGIEGQWAAALRAMGRAEVHAILAGLMAGEST